MDKEICLHPDNLQQAIKLFGSTLLLITAQIAPTACIGEIIEDNRSSSSFIDEERVSGRREEKRADYQFDQHFNLSKLKQ